MVPGWLHILSVLSLLLGFGCTAAIAWNVSQRAQQIGWRPRSGARIRPTPIAIMAAKGAAHCGSGMTLIDFLSR